MGENAVAGRVELLTGARHIECAESYDTENGGIPDTRRKQLDNVLKYITIQGAVRRT